MKIRPLPAALAVLCLSNGLIAPSNAQSTPADYASDRLAVAQWLRGMQYQNEGSGKGGIQMAEGIAIYANDGKSYYRVNPYRGNLAALNMLKSDVPGALDFAVNWIEWYFNHLRVDNSTNPPTYGTPYDRLYTQGGNEESACKTSVANAENETYSICNAVDAEDSGIATFFSVLGAARQKGASLSLFTEHQAQIEGLATTLKNLKQSDELYAALATNKSKYLEDQSEVWAGWEALSSLYSSGLGEASQAGLYGSYADHLKTALLSTGSSRFYNRRSDGLYVWARNEDDTFAAANLNQWYASTQAQMWPHLWGLVASDDPRTKSVVLATNGYWDGDPQPQWWTKMGIIKERIPNTAAPTGYDYTYYIDQGFINSSFAYAMCLAEQKSKVVSYLSGIRDRNPDITSAPYTDPPFNVDDAGWLLRILTAYADTTAPVVSFSTPEANQKLSSAALTRIAGNVSDNVGVSGVRLKLFRTRDGVTQYWNGTAFTSTVAQFDASVGATDTLSTTWGFNVTSELRAALDNGQYFVYAYGRDAAGNQNSAVSRSFTIDDLAPGATISKPTPNQSLTPSSFTTIAGSATDNTGVNQLLIKLFRSRGGVNYYWNGSSFTTTVSYVKATLASPNSTSTTWTYNVPSALKSRLDNGQYLVYVYAKDAAGNQNSAVSRAFSISGSSNLTAKDTAASGVKASSSGS